MKTQLFCIFLFGALLADAQNNLHLFKAPGTPATPKVAISWDRYYDAEALELLCKKIAKAYPNLVQLKRIGTSYQRRNLNCLVITNFKKGVPDHKPGIFVMGNIHGDELQGSEYTLYTAWYLTECFKGNKIISNLLDDKVFYIVPTVNPDGRNNFIHHPNMGGAARYSMYPHDFDKDGKYDEDPAEDLDGDGTLSQMRIKTPNGAYRIDPFDSLIMEPIGMDSVFWSKGKYRAKYPKEGNYDWMTEGGIDNDGDGKVDEEGIGMGLVNYPDYDLNRNWKYDWSTNSSHENNLGKIGKPFSFRETIAIRGFFLSHPNIVIAETFHNSGGEIYPGSGWYNDTLTTGKSDSILVDILGKQGEKMIPGYEFPKLPQRGQVIHNGLEYDWMYCLRGVYSFLIELMSGHFYYNDLSKNNWHDESYQAGHELLFDDNLIPWHKFNHPVLGEVEIGGTDKTFPNITPGFLMEYEAHRNMAYTLYLAKQAPKIIIKDIKFDSIATNVRDLAVTIYNAGLLPTHSVVDLTHHITAPDLISLETKGDVISVETNGSNCTYESNKKGIKVSNIPGHSEIVVRWRIRGAEQYKVNVNSIKGGSITASN